MYSPNKPVQAVADSNVQRFAKDLISLVRVGNNLSISSAYIQDDWVVTFRDHPSHLDVPDAMIYRNDGLFPQQR